MNSKQKTALYRIIISGILLAVSAVAASHTDSTLVKIILFAVPYLVIGYKVLAESFSKIMHRQMMDENFLMSIATIGAFFLGEYLEAVAVMLFFNIGELFESYAVGNSRKSIAALMDIRPEFANLVDGDDVKTVDPSMLSKGDTILIRPGERVPVDALVIKGSSALDTSALTGESVPREISQGSEIISGCINLNGAIYAKVTKSYENSTVAKILELVENSSLSKSKSESFITRFAKVYTPAVVGCAAFLAIVPPLVSGNFQAWIERALIFLVVSCPCALVISVPLSFFAGIGAASKHGILIKGSTYLEKMAKLSYVIFDKTGTLTEGSFRVTAIHPEKMNEHELLLLAASAESYSNHPISASIKNECMGERIPVDAEDVTEIPGCGLRVKINGKTVLVGNDKLMKQNDIAFKDCGHNGTIIHVARDGEYEGHIVISDIIKPDSKSALDELKANSNIKTVMLTGDTVKAGASVAAELGIDETHCDMLPADKVNCVEEYMREKRKNESVVFVGDGINDAPVLARADVGIAMGAMGSDAAIEAADIVLMDDKLSKIPTAVKISKKTLAIAKQNIVFAISVKLIVLLLTVLGMSNMWEAVFADVGVSVIAILNAVRALK